MDDINAVPEFAVSPPRVSIMAGFRYFHVGGRATMETIPQIAATLIERACAAYRAAYSVTVDQPPVILSYGVPDETGEFDIWAGFAVRRDLEAAGDASIEDVPPARCASMVLCGGLRHLAEAHQQLMEYVQAHGLAYGRVFREWYLYWEGEDTPNNVTLIVYELM